MRDRTPDGLPELLERRVLILDGAMGTALQGMPLTAADFGGHELEGCNEHLVLSKPEAIARVHESYLEAGADIVSSNSFGAVRHVLAEYGLSEKTADIARAAGRLAKAAAQKWSSPDKPRFAAGALGPGTKAISVTGGISFDQVAAAYAEAARGLLEGGVDLLLLETQQDTLNVKASLLGFEECFKRLGRRVPVILSVSIEPMGAMLAGQNAEALCDAVSHFDLLAAGLNCATGPEFMTDHLRTVSEVSPFFTICYPNAGLPDEHGHYHEDPKTFAERLSRFAAEGWLNIAGGCCGTTAEHIRLLSQALAGKNARRPSRAPRSALSGLESLVLDDETQKPFVVGERTNVIGSRLFRSMIAEGRFDEAAEVGRRQVRGGAHLIDVCLADPDRDEKTDIIRVLEILSRKVKAPIMIDSTDASVIEESLKRCPGRSVVNSINLEDGEERFAKVVPLLRRYGAAVVVGAIDEDKTQGMAMTRARKLAIAKRSLELLTGKYGLKPEDLIFDPLVFPAATGDKNYWGSALETIEGVRLIKKELPRCRTILGISNVSFGLPPAGREVLNAVFLHECVKAGLDFAIVNSEKLARLNMIPEDEKKLSLDLLSWRGPGDPTHPQGFDAVAAFAERYREARVVKSVSERAKLLIDERLKRNVVEGSREGLLDDLAVLIKERAALAVINGPLMAGMDEVGRLFAANEMIVAEVLQSAEVMKAAVAFLEPHMDATKSTSRGKIVLATVKGDVHDIGKNLVHIILKNNGYAVTDLGIKVPPEAIIAAAKTVSPDLIGLSGLLVKSAQQMAATAADLAAAGVRAPILVGGAALSPRFTASKIAPAYSEPVVYAKDAMSGLDIANSLLDPARRQNFLQKNGEIQEHLRQAVAASAPKLEADGANSNGAPPRPFLNRDYAAPAPPDLKPHVLADIDPEEIFRYINPVMLYGKHLGLRGNPERLLREKNPKALELFARVRELQDEILARGLLKPKAVYRFFAARSDGEKVMLYESPAAATALETFLFPRQASGERLCLADFILPASSGKTDFTAMFALTCGAGIRELSTDLREKGEYLKSHALQAVAIEAAEGFAELLHERLRAMWGIPDAPTLSIKEKFQARYRGLRVSFGYPACPDLADQAKLFKLLKPERIGMQLTEGYMMDPEASVSALVFHHPEARYFSAGPGAAVPESL
ncbi:MAG TPA: methionine synthase [Elusimicrobiota bacterium]|nr:methionine synthase [Elusimicrobiota bacterium]